MAHAHVDIWDSQAAVNNKTMGDGRIITTISAGAASIVLSRVEVARLIVDLTEAIDVRSMESVTVPRVIA